MKKFFTKMEVIERLVTDEGDTVFPGMYDLGCALLQGAAGIDEINYYIRNDEGEFPRSIPDVLLLILVHQGKIRLFTDEGEWLENKKSAKPPKSLLPPWIADAFDENGVFHTDHVNANIQGYRPC